jgi:hypothetical protein
MTCHQAEGIRRPAQELRHSPRDVTKGCTMIAETADTVALVPLVRNRIQIRSGWHAVVKGRLEQPDKRNAWQEIAK